MAREPNPEAIGVKLTQNLIYSRLFVHGFIKAEDGTDKNLIFASK